MSLKHKSVALIVLLSFGGCAFSSMEDRAKQKPISSYETAKSFDAAAANWVQSEWWKSYNDVQLNELIAEGLKGSPDIAAILARVNQAASFTQVSQSALLPQLGANAAVTSEKLSYNNIIPAPFTPNGWQDYGQGTINFSWEIDFWGKNRAALAAATSEFEAINAEKSQISLALAATIATSYAELAQLFAIRDTIASSIDVRKKALNLFKERFKNGLETKASVKEAEARLANVEGELLAIDEQIALIKNRIAALLGAGPDRGLKITRPNTSLINKFVLPNELALNLLGRRPDIVAARLQVEAKESKIKQRKAAFYPNVNLSAFIGLQSLGLNMLTNSGSDIGSVGPAIYLPIFTGGRLSGELKGAEASYDEAVANYNKTVTYALQDVANAGVSQKALSSQISKANEATNAAEGAYKIAKNRYEWGLANYIEVLYAADNLLVSQRSLANLKARSLILDIAMNRALGGGYIDATKNIKG
ncbi:MAG: hypothetical protein RL154_864 [Pseudomonadota bacterium]